MQCSSIHGAVDVMRVVNSCVLVQSDSLCKHVCRLRVVATYIEGKLLISCVLVTAFCALFSTAD
jgi:hypothetical protein